jgi:hypothetical protein
MKEVLDRLEKRKREVARHPLYAWLQSDRVPLEDRFIFAPVFVSFIMGFSDLNKWFMRYASPEGDGQQAINQHTYEDETHSRLFLEDWDKLGFDGRLGWNAGETIKWYYAANETEIFRRYGMEIMRMCVENDDTLVRFALMSAIEACGNVFFTVTSAVATELSATTGKDYRYFGPHHLRRETGHVLTGGHLLGSVVLTGWRRERSLVLVDRIFDMFLAENDHLLSYAEAMLRTKDNPPEVGAASAPAHARRPQGQPREAPRASPAAVTKAQAEVQRVLKERMTVSSGHDFFRWMRQKDDLSAGEKLRRFIALWTPDVMGYGDLCRYALAYHEPADRRERAINRWARDLSSHHRLFLQDWSELGMNELVGWTASETLRFYCLSEETEMQRKNMASFISLAYAHPRPVLRFWLVTALESSGEAFFHNTCMLAERFERETGKRLDYLAHRHDLCHPVQERDDEADAVVFQSEQLDAAERDTAIGLIHTVFDSIDAQYSLSLDRAATNAFMSG